MIKGVELTLQDGSKDWYDPVKWPDGFKETETEYQIDNGYLVYTVSKDKVKSFTTYELCQKCGHDMQGDEVCSRCGNTKEKGE